MVRTTAKVASTEKPTVTRPEIRFYVEVFHQPEARRIGPAFLNLSIRGAVHPIGQQAVDDCRQYDIEEHVHADLQYTDAGVRHLYRTELRIKTAQRRYAVRR
jgi:hypothetical protein